MFCPGPLPAPRASAFSDRIGSFMLCRCFIERRLKYPTCRVQNPDIPRTHTCTIELEAGSYRCLSGAKFQGVKGFPLGLPPPYTASFRCLSRKMSVASESTLLDEGPNRTPPTYDTAPAKSCDLNPGKADPGSGIDQLPIRVLTNYQLLNQLCLKRSFYYFMFDNLRNGHAGGFGTPVSSLRTFLSVEADRPHRVWCV